MPAVPVRIEADPPAHLATLGSALNLAVLLEIHRADLAEHGRREIRASKSLSFSKLIALIIRLAFDRQDIGENTSVNFTVQTKRREAERVVAGELLEAMTIEHRQHRGLQPNAPAGWEVSRVALKADSQLVPLKAAVSYKPTVYSSISNGAGNNPHQLLFNYRRFTLHQRLVGALPSGFALNPVPLGAEELHLILLNLMHDIAYERGETRHCAFFGLYLFHLHLGDLRRHSLAPEPLHHALRSLYLNLPNDGQDGLNGSGLTKTFFRAVEMTARALPQINPDLLEDQRNWHLNRRAQGGTGGCRDVEVLLQQYRGFFEASLRLLRVAIDGPKTHPAEFPSTALSLSKSAYHPVARRTFS
ncbi:hypothetical protein JCM6882_009192 [Rhodosporidiobolus microsporus]